jgi:heme exporter protein C
VTRPSTVRIVAWLWFAATIAVLVVGLRQALIIAPTEETMGNLQRIFYYHVPHNIVGMIFPYVNLLASLSYLFWRSRDPLKALTADAIAVASAEVTVLYIGIGLLTGMLWGKPAWGIWWAWDARLTTALLLWLLYVSYLLLRRFSPTGQTGVLSAVLSIFAAIDVPIVWMSIRWWRTQHPAPVFGGGPDSFLDPAMLRAFLWNLAGWFMWGTLVMLFRFALERRRQLAEQDDALLAIEASLETPQ